MYDFKDIFGIDLYIYIYEGIYRIVYVYFRYVEVCMDIGVYGGNWDGYIYICIYIDLVVFLLIFFKRVFRVSCLVYIVV